MRYAVASKTDPSARLVRILTGPDAGKYGFAHAQADMGDPVLYSTWRGALAAASMHGGEVVAAEGSPAGDCETCGRWTGQREEGMCKPCRERLLHRVGNGGW